MGGERLIGLLPMWQCVHFKATSTELAVWEHGRAQFWDSALRGSGVLRAACFWLEAAAALDMPAALAMFDIKKFLDSLNPALLCQQLVGLGYPPVMLALHCLAHWAARIITHAGQASGFIIPARSVLQGRGASCSFAMWFTIELCETAHRCLPRSIIGIHVDDLDSLQVGSRRMVVKETVEAARVVHSKLGGLKLRMASKSNVVASDLAYAQEISQRCADLGIRTQAKATGKELGAPVGGGKRRSVAPLLKRCKVGKARGHRYQVIHHILEYPLKYKVGRLCT